MQLLRWLSLTGTGVVRPRTCGYCLGRCTAVHHHPTSKQQVTRMVDRCGLVVVYVCRCEGWCRFMQDYVGVYVCSIYVCMFVLFVCPSICMYPHISAHVRTYDLYICHARVCMHLCMYMYVYVCLCNTYRSARGYVLQSSYQVFSEFWWFLLLIKAKKQYPLLFEMIDSHCIWVYFFSIDVTVLILGICLKGSYLDQYQPSLHSEPNPWGYQVSKQHPPRK